MMSFFEATDFARSTLSMIASYSVSLFGEGKSSRMTCNTPKYTLAVFEHV